MKPKIVNAKKPRSANRRKPRSRPARCSAAHVHFEITTREGNRAMIKGDPSMPETTMRAIASMIDALAQAIVRGEVKPLNAAGERQPAENQKP